MRSASPAPVASAPQQSNSSYRNAPMSSSHMDGSVRTGSTRYALPARAASSAVSDTSITGAGSPNNTDSQPTLSVPVAFSFGDEDDDDELACTIAPRSLAQRVSNTGPHVPASKILPHHGSLVLFRTGGFIRTRRRPSPGANSRSGSEAAAGAAASPAQRPLRHAPFDTLSATSAGGTSIRPGVPAVSLGASGLSHSMRRETSPTAAARSMSGSQSPHTVTRASTAQPTETKERCEPLPLQRIDTIEVTRHPRYPHYCRLVFAAPEAPLPPPTLGNVISDIESASSSDSDGLVTDDASTPSTSSLLPGAVGLGFESHGEMLDACLVIQDIAVHHRSDLRRKPRRTIFAFV